MKKQYLYERPTQRLLNAIEEVEQMIKNKNKGRQVDLAIAELKLAYIE
jgi:hypothetical protein